MIYGAPELSATLFHEVPLGIGDPFLYLENDGRRATTVSVLEADRVSALGLEVLEPATLGRDDLIAAGLDTLAIDAEIALRAARALGIAAATVPPEFPLFVADHLRAEGLELTIDDGLFAARRRVKTATELDGIRRAQRAADAAMGTAAALIRELRPGLTSEEVRAAMQSVAEEHGCELSDDAIVSHGPQSASGHESGSGEIGRGEPVVVDIWPRDKASRCYADMTRTFVGGGVEPPAELAEFWRLTRDALDRVYADLRAGANGRALFERSCEPYIEAGQPTQLTKQPGEVLEDGYFHGLGHGVGLEVHERPHMGRIGDDLVEGDVVTVEPGCYRRGFGGCRLEDLVVVTADGCEVLTDFPYDL
ncbi:MAG TPA: M24 family metallopeptidase [Solirubrobacter sp.]|nr:M24 family metallopeptidase [Solirubrobacter sp.]